ncbi:DUF397 domain-containing protein [Pseudonocardia nantongensis]|uniref:DUF397 domain-containing protein n=1 Tax=Pseudonocardia nantongensis TaxID=1181885 RepID=UPI00397B6E1C
MSEARYVTSSYCLDGDCVAVAADAGGGVVLKDTKGSGTLSFTADEWSAFLAGVRAGEFDDARLRG